MRSPIVFALALAACGSSGSQALTVVDGGDVDDDGGGPRRGGMQVGNVPGADAAAVTPDVLAAVDVGAPASVLPAVPALEACSVASVPAAQWDLRACRGGLSAYAPNVTCAESLAPRPGRSCLLDWTEQTIGRRRVVVAAACNECPAAVPACAATAKLGEKCPAPWPNLGGNACHVCNVVDVCASAPNVVCVPSCDACKWGGQ